MSTNNAHTLQLDITGYTAITYAERDMLGIFSLGKRSDPMEAAKPTIDLDAAREVAAEDGRLIYLKARIAWYGNDDVTIARVGGLCIAVQSPDFRPGERFTVTVCDLDDKYGELDADLIDPELADLASEALTDHLHG